MKNEKEIYLEYLDTNKMRGEVETFLFLVLHWAWPIVQWWVYWKPDDQNAEIGEPHGQHKERERTVSVEADWAEFGSRSHL